MPPLLLSLSPPPPTLWSNNNNNNSNNINFYEISMLNTIILQEYVFSCFHFIMKSFSFSCFASFIGSFIEELSTQTNYKNFLLLLCCCCCCCFKIHNCLSKRMPLCLIKASIGCHHHHYQRWSTSYHHHHHHIPSLHLVHFISFNFVALVVAV